MFHDKATTLLKMGNLIGAEIYFDKILKINPTDQIGSVHLRILSGHFILKYFEFIIFRIYSCYIPLKIYKIILFSC
jgi:hypothetical protein